jgi:hypothetical protein
MIQRQPERDKSRNRTPGEGKGGQTAEGLHTGVRVCEVCGNEYDKPLEILMNGISHYFDSFECAIQALAPKCAHCQCRIIGHGIEAGGTMYCCAHCAKHSGVTAVADRA